MINLFHYIEFNQNVAFSFYFGGVMVKLTKNVHEMVQNRPKPSFLMGGGGVSPLFLPHLGEIHSLILKYRGGLDC